MKKLVLVLFLLIFSFSFSQNKLKRAKENLNSNSSSTHKEASNLKIEETDSQSSFIEDTVGSLFTELFFLITYKTVLGNFEKRSFNPHAFFNETINGEYNYGLEEKSVNKLIHANANYLIGNPINSFEANLNYRFSTFVGLKFTHNHFFENGLSETEHLDSSSLMLNYYRVREKSVTGWWGIGMAYVANGINTLGFSYNFGLEIFAFKPLSFYINYKQVFINESAINFFNFKTKYHRKKAAYYLGYSAISLAKIKASGPVLGINIGF